MKNQKRFLRSGDVRLRGTIQKPLENPRLQKKTTLKGGFTSRGKNCNIHPIHATKILNKILKTYRREMSLSLVMINHQLKLI